MKERFFNYEIAAIAEALYNETDTAETSRGAWAWSLYYVLADFFGNPLPAPQWEERWHQWNTDHLYRNALSSKNRKHGDLVCSFDTIKRKGNSLEIEGKLNGDVQKEFILKVSKSDFGTLVSAPVNATHLFLDKQEVDDLFNALGEINAREYTEYQHVKVESLLAVVNEIRKVYRKADPAGKEYLETVIGAAIFYLPHPVNECFNGYCSISALNNALKGNSMVKEHLFPRKRAGRDVLMNEYSKEDFIRNVKDKYRIFMYLTAEENKLTINYEGTHDEELKKLKIHRFPDLEESPFNKNHTLFKKFITWVRAHHAESRELTPEDADRYLDAFMESGMR